MALSMARSAATGLAALMLFIPGGVASAAETTVSAFSTWSARGDFYQTGPEEATFAGILSGPLYVEGADGSVEAGVIICPGRLQVNTADLSQTAVADCTILTAEGERVYGEFECSGAYREGCAGQFTLTGGTGSREGISGGGPIEFLNAMPDLLAAPGNIVSTEAAGLARWPALTFTLP